MAFGWVKSCVTISLPRLDSLAALVTMIPAAVDVRSAGICANKTLTDCQYGIDGKRLIDRHAFLNNTNYQSADDIYKDNNDTGNGIAPDKLAGTIHCAIKVGLHLNLFSSSAGRRIIDEAGVEVGIYAHLFARHGIEGKPRGHFSDTTGAFCDYDKVNNHEDKKDNGAYDIIPADNKRSETL